MSTTPGIITPNRNDVLSHPQYQLFAFEIKYIKAPQSTRLRRGFALDWNYTRACTASSVVSTSFAM
jgi:hypothetical protein